MTLTDWIEFPPEPKQLILVWQAPRSVQDRSRWAVGRLRKAGEEAVFDYLGGDEFADLNLGRSIKELRQAGFSGYPAFDFAHPAPIGYRHKVLEAFLRRLPSPSRTDFPQYLTYHHLRPGTALSPFSMLAVTEARLPSDGFSLIDPLDSSVGRADILIEIAGFRHLGSADAALQPGDRLELCPEPANLIDSHAVQIKAGGRPIGYVNRIQASSIAEWLKQRSVTCWIARLNGQVDAPRAYAFVKVRPDGHSITAWCEAEIEECEPANTSLLQA